MNRQKGLLVLAALALVILFPFNHAVAQKWDPNQKSGTRASTPTQKSAPSKTAPNAKGKSTKAADTAPTGDAYHINVRITTLKDSTIYLAYHFGDKQYMKDTIKLNSNGEGVFKGKEKLDQGIFLVVMPNKTYFEILIGDNQTFSVVNDTANFITNFQQTGSDENQVFYDDMRFIQAKQKEREELNKQLKEADKDEAKKKLVKDKLSQLDKDVIANRKKIRETHPDYLYSKILYMLEEVEVPEAPKNAKGEPIDSFFAFHFFKAHYFDHIDLADQRMLKTPILYGKVDNYLDKVCLQDFDTINNEVDMILTKSKPNQECFRFWLVTLLNKYANTKVMCQEAVYVHLVKNYYDKGMATWLDSADMFRISKTAADMEPTLCNKQTPGLMLKDTSGNYHSLYDIKSKYIILFIYAPDCGHCQKETPHLVNQYDSLKTKYDITVFAASTETEREKWTKFIKDYKTGQFINVADIELHDNFRQIYDVKSTPRIFLLDKNRKIVAKRFGAEQLGVVLENLEKLEKEKQRKLEKDKNRPMEDNIEGTQKAGGEGQSPKK